MKNIAEPPQADICLEVRQVSVLSGRRSAGSDVDVPALHFLQDAGFINSQKVDGVNPRIAAMAPDDGTMLIELSPNILHPQRFKMLAQRNGRLVEIDNGAVIYASSRNGSKKLVDIECLGHEIADWHINCCALATAESLLSDEEQKRLDEHEGVIIHGMRNFFDIGKALQAIKDGKLYRSSHNTFEAYCEERLCLNRTYVYRIILAAEAFAAIMSSKPAVIPENECQLRPLAHLPSARIVSVWRKACSLAGGLPVTSRFVTNALGRHGKTETSTSDGVFRRQVTALAGRVIRLAIGGERSEALQACDELRELVSTMAVEK